MKSALRMCGPNSFCIGAMRIFIVGSALFTATIANAQSLGQTEDRPEIAEPGKRPVTEKVTYLGITTKSVDADLQAQLKLPDGVGLVVTFVDAKGPATDDIQPGDILQKLDDQILIDTHQLVTLVRLHHPGDSVAVSIIHQAKPNIVTIKLGEKEHHIVGESKDWTTGTNGADSGIPGVPVPDFEYHPPANSFSQVSMAFDDGTYSAHVDTDKAGVKQMVVKDKQGKVVANGPVDTEDQWNRFPAEVRGHLEVIHKMLNKKQPGAMNFPDGFTPRLSPPSALPRSFAHAEAHSESHASN